MHSTLPSIPGFCTRTALRLLLAAALAVGILSSAPTVDAHATTAATKVDRAMHVAVNQKGDPYQYGAAGPYRFDCSGLTYYSFRKAGFSNMPRTSSAQARFADRIPKSSMHRGDLMFFYDGGGVYHVGVFAGFANGHRMVLHAPYSGTRVRTDRVWTSRWFAGTLRHR